MWSAVITPATRTVYSYGYTNFSRFLVMSGHSTDPWFYPIPENVLIYFLAHCFHVLQLKHSTIQTYLAGIRFNYLQQGFNNPLTAPNGLPFMRLQMLLKAVKKLQGAPSKLRYPIDAPLLKHLCSALMSGIFGPFTDRMLTAACTLAFFGFMRCGEFTASSTTFDPLVHLTIEDASFDSYCSKLLLFLKQSKTDIFRQGVIIPLFRTGSDICPIKAMLSYLEIRKKCGCSSKDPLFVTADGLILTRSRFLSMLKDLLGRLGYNQKEYTGHSFRIGAATTASKASVQDHLIKCLGRWSSDCYVRYIRTSESALKAAHEMIDKQ